MLPGSQTSPRWDNDALFDTYFCALGLDNSNRAKGGRRGELTVQPVHRASRSSRRFAGVRIERERPNNRQDRTRGPQLWSFCPGLRSRGAWLLQGKWRDGRDHRLSRRARGARGTRGRGRRHHQFLSAWRGAGSQEGHQGKGRWHRIGEASRLAHRGHGQFVVPHVRGRCRQEGRRDRERRHHRLLCALGGKKGGRPGRDDPLGAPALIPTLKSGQIDVAVLNSPLSFRMIIPGERRSLVDLGKDMEPTLPDVWVATQSLIDGNPKAIEGTLRSIYKATAYMKKNRAF